MFRDVNDQHARGVLLAATRATTTAWGGRRAGDRRARTQAIAYWLGTLRYVPDVLEITARLGCSRATAYRWFRFATDAAAQMPETQP